MPPNSQILARDAATIAATAAPAPVRPHEAPGKWVFPPERAPNGKKPLSPGWWELHSQEWLKLSGRQRPICNNKLNKVLTGTLSSSRVAAELGPRRPRSGRACVPIGRVAAENAKNAFPDRKP